MTASKSTQWSIAEVQTLLCLVAEDRIQKELDGATRNEKVYKEVAKLMEDHGYIRSYVQCRDKLKKLKSMESQEGHNPDLDWRGKSAKPYGIRTESIPYGFRTVWQEFRTDSVRF